MNHLPSPSRRTVLVASAGSGLTLAATGPAATAATQASTSALRGRSAVQYAYMGSRTTRQRNARGAGITVWRIDPGQDSWNLLQTVPADGDTTTPTPPGAIPVNPSFLALNPDRHPASTPSTATLRPSAPSPSTPRAAL
jgi:hypothetical protein